MTTRLFFVCLIVVACSQPKPIQKPDDCAELIATVETGVQIARQDPMVLSAKVTDLDCVNGELFYTFQFTAIGKENIVTAEGKFKTWTDSTGEIRIELLSHREIESHSLNESAKI